ncbi:hypothetical protein ACH3VR_19785 [Microbacterium sp. B2969]|uniref:Uncharacterized protein n=1 Tax=Microbacterium alkaliflavum TaxID=3248839 RepID=A0ABW7QE20_9MICO
MVEQSRGAAGHRFERWFELEVVEPMADFRNPRQEWRQQVAVMGEFVVPDGARLGDPGCSGVEHLTALGDGPIDTVGDTEHVPVDIVDACDDLPAAIE